MSCAPTEPVETHDDTSILQVFINNSLETLDMNLDIDGSGNIEPLELGLQKWEDGRIVELNCFNIGLSGNIPTSIGNLTELTHLGLKNNNLSGVIPESIGNLTNLRQLNLAANTLSGSIPDTIGNLKSLTRLVLSNNEFSGSIPNSIGKLSVLHTFLADSNNLSGTIPDDICTIYPNFIDYNLAYNKFCLTLPHCLDKPNDIRFQNCDTSCGSEYKFINGYCYLQTDLNVLDSIIINSNSDSLNMNMDIDSSGTIENLELGTQIWRDGRLETLHCFIDDSDCNISGQIPNNIGDLDKLKVLSLQVNNLFGEIPKSIGNLIELEGINLAYNNLTGELPESILNLPNLTSLSVGKNQLSGSIPEDICTKFSEMEKLILSENTFCPCYPKCSIESDYYDEFINTQDITDCLYCNDGYTQICYDLPEVVSVLEGDPLCFKTDNLAVLEAFIDSSLAIFPDSLDISMLSDTTDSIDELKPLELGEQSWANGQLIIFDASNRGLSGEIPQNINNLDTLFILSLSNNQLSGILPEPFYNLTQLQTLHLDGNNLSGDISQSICDIIGLVWEADKAQILYSRSYLFDNKFCPPYPVCGEGSITSEESQECPDSSDDD